MKAKTAKQKKSVSICAFAIVVAGAAAAYAQSDIDTLRQACMDNSNDLETRIQACNHLSYEIGQAVASGNYNGNAVQDIADAQAAAMRAIGDKAAQQAAARSRASRQERKSICYETNRYGITGVAPAGSMCAGAAE